MAACEGCSFPHMSSSSSPSSADERRGRNSPWTEKAPLERREAVDRRGSDASDLRGRSWSAAAPASELTALCRRSPADHSEEGRLARRERACLEDAGLFSTSGKREQEREREKRNEREEHCERSPGDGGKGSSDAPIGWPLSRMPYERKTKN